MASLANLGATAEQLLAGFAKQLAGQNIDLPARQYVAPGQAIPWDGEQLGVNLQSIDQGQPGIAFTGTYVPQATNLFATFAVWIVRVIPALSGEGTLEEMVPDAAELDQAGQAAMSDAAALVHAALALHTNYMLTGPGEGFEIGACSPVGPEGGLSGHRLLLAISLT